jgi:hypothetical protein
MKLEYKIKEGIFISPKLYYNELENGEEIIKSKGINLDENGNKILNKNDFIKLYSGLNVIKERSSFFRNNKTFSVSYNKMVTN